MKKLLLILLLLPCIAEAQNWSVQVKKYGEIATSDRYIISHVSQGKQTGMIEIIGRSNEDVETHYFSVDTLMIGSNVAVYYHTHHGTIIYFPANKEVIWIRKRDGKTITFQ